MQLGLVMQGWRGSPYKYRLPEGSPLSVGALRGKCADVPEM